MKTRFWSSDWFAGLLITLVVVAFSGSAPFQSLERSFYDWGVRSTDRLPSEKIAIIAIDDESIANFESWPWPRDLHATLIDQLAEGGAKVIGHTVFFVDPQRQAGSDYIRELIQFVSTASFNEAPADIDALGTMLEIESGNRAVAEILAFYRESSLNTRLSQDIETLRAGLFEAEQSLNTDAILAASIERAGNVVLAAFSRRACSAAIPMPTCPSTCCATRCRRNASPTTSARRRQACCRCRRWRRCRRSPRSVPARPPSAT